MASYNNARIVGYIVTGPFIGNDKYNCEFMLLTLRVVNREIEGYVKPEFQEIMVYLDDSSPSILNTAKRLVQYDLIDVEGFIVVNQIHRHSLCPFCETTNVKEMGTQCFVYPLHLRKIDNLATAAVYNESLPNQILKNHYKEISNKVVLMGTVSGDIFIPDSKVFNCRYKLSVKRKYFISNQDDVNRDFIYVYSFGKQAINDKIFLRPGSLVMVVGFLRYRSVHSDQECSKCGKTYKYPSIATELVAYNVEYLRNYNTLEEATSIKSELMEENLL